MHALDIDQLRTLTMVIDEGSLTAAAPRVSLTQSAVSEQMRKLEERVGLPLLTRSKTGVVPTPAGLRLVGYARRMLALSDEAFRDVRDEALQGDFRFAVTDYFRPGDLATLLARLNVAYPELRMHVTVQKSGTIERGYADGDFDVALTMRILDRPRAQAVRVSRDVSISREPLLWMGATGRQATPDQPHRLLALPDTCSLHRFTVDLLRRRRIPFTIALVASGVAGLQSALVAGLGIACLNESSLCAGLVRLGRSHRLPALPDVDFRLLAPRKNETALVAEVRRVIAAALG